MHLFVLMWISQGARKPHLKALNVVNCSKIRGTYKMFYQQSFSHNLVSFRRAYQCHCQPCKKGTFLFKKGTFSHHFKSWGGTCPQCPPFLRPCFILEVLMHACNGIVISNAYSQPREHSMQWLVIAIHIVIMQSISSC